MRAKPIEVDSVNYLIPVDAELSNPSDVKFETVMLDDAVGASLNTGKLSMFWWMPAAITLFLNR